MAERVSVKEKVRDASFDEAPKPINKATLIAAIGGILLLIIGSILIWSFYENSAGGENTNTQTTANSANP